MIERELSPLVAGLNDEQQRAVVTVDGPVLVVAGPGSGKTRVLTHRIAFLIQERNVLPDQILAVTFTNKAAREMRDRIERLVGKQAAAGLVMGTFHSFGVRLLRQNPGIVADRLGLLPNFLIYDDADQMEIMKRSIVDVGLDPKQVAPRRVLSRVSAAKAMLVTADEFASQTANYGDEVVARAYAAYQRLLRKANAVDFDDLLALPIRLFDEAPALLERYQSRFRYIMVDEYQDTNRVQYVLVTALAAIHRNLFVVGDPDQSIYGWRQADIRNILDFEKDYPDATRIHLELNYRSSRRIVDAADRVIRINTQRIDRRLRTENDDGEEVVLRELSDGAHEASFIVGEIRRLMKSSDIGGESFAVMYRTTAQSRVIEEAFRVSDIPYRIVGGVRFYDRREVKDVLAVLRLLHNPADEVSLQRALDNLPIGRGLGPKALDTLRLWANQHGEPFLNALVAFAPEKTATTTSPPSLSGSAKSAAQRFGSAVASLRSVAGTVPLTELLDALLDATKYQDSFDQENEEELQRWANVLELRSDLAKYDLLEPADALATYLEQVALVSDVDTMEDDSRRRVTLITLHSAKGLEFPIVFIAGVEDGLLPINRAIEAEWNDPMPMEEERRLFYVGITRAQNLLYITFAARRLAYGSFQPGLPSRFLAALPEIGVRSAVRSSTRSGRLSEQVRERTGATDDTGMVSRSSHTAGSPAAAPTAFQRVRPGQRVFHVKFGEGVVLNVVDKPEDQEVTVDFKREGRKIFMASFAHFDLID